MQMKLPDAERKAFVAYLDEFQTYATEHIAEAIEETRKYKLSLVLACQSLGQIDGSARRSDVGRSIIANVANLISFRLGVDDAAILAKWFEPDASTDDLLYLPNYQAVARLMVDGQALRPVEFTTAPPQVAMR
jgi:TraM recognition site of TraD and TraG